MRTAILLIFIFVVQATYGQKNYVVMNLQGAAWKTADKQQHSLKIGQQLEKNETITIDKNSRIVLICPNYSPISLGPDTAFLLSGSLASCTRRFNSITGDYFRYMWNELTHPHSSVEKDRRKYMGNHYGAVVRGVTIKTDPALDTINSYQSDLFIRWKSDKGGNGSSFVVYDNSQGGKKLFSSPVRNGSISLNEIRKHVNGKNPVYWTFKKGNKEAEKRNVIKFWDTGDYVSYYEDLKRSSLLEPESAEWHYMLGFCLEADHFFAEAYEHYKTANQLNPGEARYKTTVEDMQERYF